MKRIDMVHRLSDELASFFSHYSLRERNLLADFCLTVVEKEGMLPPERSVKQCDNDSGCIDEGYNIVFENSWGEDE